MENPDLDQLKNLLKQKRPLDAERQILLTRQRNGLALKTVQQSRLSLLEQYHLHVLAWITSLPEDEAYVVQRHLIDGID